MANPSRARADHHERGSYVVATPIPGYQRFMLSY